MLTHHSFKFGFYWFEVFMCVLRISTKNHEDVSVQIQEKRGYFSFCIMLVRLQQGSKGNCVSEWRMRGPSCLRA